MSENKKNKENQEDAYTVDADKTGMMDVPGLTKLLNRKSLRVPAPPKEEKAQEKSEKSPPQFEGKEVPQAPPEPAIEISAAENDTKENPPKEKPKTTLVQPAKKRQKTKEIRKLIHWETKTLQNSDDPLGKAIYYLMHNGAQCGLFLNLSVSASKADAPIFKPLAAVEAQPEQEELWSGMSWNRSKRGWPRSGWCPACSTRPS